MRSKSMHSCPPRSIYIDFGVNWCNTLELHHRVAPGRAHWLVVGWEAAPLIVPHAESCMHALSAGAPLPALPAVPQTGSTHELAMHVKRTPALASQLASCRFRGKSPSARGRGRSDTGGEARLKECFFDHPAVRANLARVRPEPALSSNASLLRTRLELLGRTCGKRRSR